MVSVAIIVPKSCLSVITIVCVRCGNCLMKRLANQTVQRTGASRVAQRQIQRHRRLAPVADLFVRPLRTMSPSTIQQNFANLYGVPSWHVCQGYGSFLTFEFGTPHQEIEPVINRESKREGSRPTRMVTIRGDWHLWIY